MARILLGVSGGIAAYKALELVRLATAAGHAVRAIQTPASLRFVGSASLAALTGAPVLSDEFEEDPARGAFPGDGLPTHRPLSHLELVRNADVFLIAPATANTVARLAHGLADNLLCSAALAARCPVIVAPAMNNHMYEHPATRANVELLRGRGVTVLEPGVGRLGSVGEWGVGRLAEPADLLAACEALLPGQPGAGTGVGDPTPGDALAPGALEGVRVLVSAGGTREPIDSVRYVGNRSSGRMGFALADAAVARGADVTVVAANVALARHPQVHYDDVVTADELHAACLRRFAACDVLLMAAAVSDFRPRQAAADKLKKHDHGDGLIVALEATADTLAELGRRRLAHQTLVGFAAEHGADGVPAARGKLEAKGLDAVVLNDISRPDIGFEAEDNEVTIVTAEGEQRVARGPKLAVAATILDAVTRLRQSRAQAIA